jgi:uncharacterized protein (TIGR02452 family)
MLRGIAGETRAVLPDILSQISSFDATISSFHLLKDLARLDPKDCPGFQLPESDTEAGRKGCRIKILDQDTFDAALELQPDTTVESVLPQPTPAPILEFKDGEYQEPNDTKPAETSAEAPAPNTASVKKPVALLNLASEKHPGGGWLNGAMAQEEALCYRSSLYLTLHGSYYPLPLLSALYSPNVVLIRDAIGRGHGLLHPTIPAASLPVTSVITVAALRRPEKNEDNKFAKPPDREATKSKMRLVLRVAAHQGHTKIVLGAMGCGAFANPPGDVADCFLEVLQEDEFAGGWWEDVVFAVLDNAREGRGGKDGSGNFGIFHRALDGVIV